MHIYTYTRHRGAGEWISIFQAGRDLHWYGNAGVAPAEHSGDTFVKRSRHWSLICLHFCSDGGTVGPPGCGDRLHVAQHRLWTKTSFHCGSIEPRLYWHASCGVSISPSAISPMSSEHDMAGIPFF